MDESSKQALFNALQTSISSDRLATYLKASGFNRERALDLYLWNVAIGEAFHLPIQAVEVGLRNCVNRALCAEFDVHWWENKSFNDCIADDHQRKSDIEMAVKRIGHRGKQPVTGQIVATLSFGFWVGMLAAKYNQSIWSKQISSAFPYLPTGKNRKNIHVSAKRVADLRNRIWHHEPVFKMDVSEEFAVAIELLRWICPTKAEWVRPRCRVQKLLREKP